MCAAHAEFVVTLSGHPPRAIPLDADAIDLEDRADHLSKVIEALSVYLAVILDDTAQNVPGRLVFPMLRHTSPTGAHLVAPPTTPAFWKLTYDEVSSLSARQTVLMCGAILVAAK